LSADHSANDALASAETAARSRPNYLFAALMAAPAAALAGRTTGAHEAIENLRRIAPQLRISNVAEIQTMQPADTAPPHSRRRGSNPAPRYSNPKTSTNG
jgi:hypothetical protein